MITPDDFAAWVGATWEVLVGLMVLAAVAGILAGGSALAILVSFAAIFAPRVALRRAVRGRHRRRI